MRFRKARGKNKAVVTMTQSEVVDACCKYLADQGVVMGDICWLKINKKETARKINRVEFSSEFTAKKEQP